jgi:hypothetical protein
MTLKTSVTQHAKTVIEKFNAKFPNINSATQTTGEIQSFISQELSSLSSEIVKTIEGMKKDFEADDFAFLEPEKMGYNQALSDLLITLRERGLIE